MKKLLICFVMLMSLSNLPYASAKYLPAACRLKENIEENKNKGKDKASYISPEWGGFSFNTP